MDAIEIWRMNAFTDYPFSGNPAGVVLDGDALSDSQMQLIAPQLNSISETAYVCSATEPDADLRLRYFTSSMEVDLCGHATIAALFALVASGRLKGATEHRAIKAQTCSGVLKLGLEFVDGKLAWASMTQPMAQHGQPTNPELSAAVLGLNPSDISGDLPVACANTGIWSCYVPLVDLDALSKIAIDSERIECLWPDNSAFAGVYPFVVLDGEGAAGIVRARGRYFSPPKYGIVEDPVTGTASGALAAYLIRQGAMSATAQLQVQQGVEMGCPGTLQAVQTAAGAIEIRGHAVPIYRGRLVL